MLKKKKGKKKVKLKNNEQNFRTWLFQTQQDLPLNFQYFFQSKTTRDTPVVEQIQFIAFYNERKHTPGRIVGAFQ